MDDVTLDKHPEPPGEAPGSLAQDPQLRRDLQATLAARQELGSAYETELVDAFLRRIDQATDARIQQRLAQPPAPRADPTRTLAVALGLAIPLIAIAGDIAGGPGIVAVLALIGVLVVYFDRRHT